jgi:hypothetical protein
MQTSWRLDDRGKVDRSVVDAIEDVGEDGQRDRLALIIRSLRVMGPSFSRSVSDFVTGCLIRMQALTRCSCQKQMTGLLEYDAASWSSTAPSVLHLSQ